MATPIGNLGDITYRAVETLKQADLIAAEDTRFSRKLLQHYGITTPMITVHEHNEQAMVDKLLARLNSGENIALISDAGTPLISDPGYRLVSGLRRHAVRITPIPGASSILTALCASGVPTDHFRYAGFLARSGKARTQALNRLISSDETSIVLESPRRLLATLRELQPLDSKREIVVARELTKLHEEFVSGTVDDVIAHFEQQEPRGEIVLLLSPASDEDIELSDQQIIEFLNTSAMQALPPSARAKAVAKTLGLAKSRVYALISNG